MNLPHSYCVTEFSFETSFETLLATSFNGVFAVIPSVLAVMQDAGEKAAEGAAELAPEAADVPFIQQLVNNPLFPIAGVMLIFYFVLIAPERRRRDEEAKRHAGIKKNDRVITSGGLHGKVSAARSDSDVVTVQLDDNGTLRVKVSRWALTVVDETKPNKEAKD